MIYLSCQFYLKDHIKFSEDIIRDMSSRNFYIKDLNKQDEILNADDNFMELAVLRAYKIDIDDDNTHIIKFLAAVDVSKNMKINLSEFKIELCEYIINNITIFSDMKFSDTVGRRKIEELNTNIAYGIISDRKTKINNSELYVSANADSSIVVPHGSHDLINDKQITNKLFFNSLFKEYKRIEASGNKVWQYYGHPTHYIIYKNNMNYEIIKILIDILAYNNRLLSRNAVVTYGIFQSPIDYEHAAGGTMVMNINSVNVNVGNMAYRDPSSIEISDIVNMVDKCKKYRHNNLYIFIINDIKTENILRDICGDSINLYTIGAKNDISYAETRKYLSEKAKEDGFTKFSGKVEKRSYSETEIYNIYDDWKDSHLVKSIFPMYKNGKNSSNKSYIKGSANKEMESMIGLTNVKSTIKEIIAYFNLQKKYKEKNITLNNACRHMVFTGNPGTAKTTVARLISKILKDNGILDTGTYVEVGRSDLVEQYVGWTAKNTKVKILSAKGGVLFIDEAYSLIDGNDKSFGQEAIDTLVEMMDIIKDDTIIIFAGYPDEMEKFINTNPGIRSRIGFHVKFPNYTEDELIDILKLQAKKQNITITDNALEKVREEIKLKIGSKDFGNGRFVRGLLEKSLMKKSVRHMEEEDSDIFTLTSNDIANISIGKPVIKNKVGFVGN